MRKSIKATVNVVKQNVTNNTQRVALKLLAAEGAWVPRSKLVTIPSATSRIRDLRKENFGNFEVECKSNTELARRTSKRTFYYRINPDKVTKKQLSKLFPVAEKTAVVSP